MRESGAGAALGRLQKGVLCSGNTKHETTGVKKAFHSQRTLGFSAAPADKSKFVLLFLKTQRRARLT